MLFLEERGGPPGTSHGNAYVAVAEENGNVVLFGHVDGFQHLGAGQNTKLIPQSLLIGGQQDVGQHGTELFFADHLFEVERLPFLLLGQGFVPAGIQFHTDRIRPFLFDDGTNQIRGLL